MLVSAYVTTKGGTFTGTTTFNGNTLKVIDHLHMKALQEVTGILIFLQTEMDLLVWVVNTV